MKLQCWALLVVLALFGTPRMAGAQPLADKVPADALLYVGWAGAQGLPGYDLSHFKAILDASHFPQVLTEVLPKLMDRIGQQDPEARSVMQIIGQFGPTLWKYPTALYVGPVDLSGPQPLPHLALYCQAGADAAALKQSADGLLAAVPAPPELKPVTTVTDGLFTLTVGAPAENAGKLATLSQDARFTAALAQVDKTPALMVYADTTAILKTINQGVTKWGAPEVQETWPKVQKALGLDGLQQIALTAGFDGKDWSSRCFIAAPAPRTGLLDLLDNGPVSEQVLDLLPGTAASAGAFKINAGKIFREIRTMAVTIDPQAQQDFAQGLDEARKAVGLDIEKDLLPALGPEWAFYIDRNVGGSSVLGFILINHLQDAVAAEKHLSQLEKVANEEMARNNRDDERIQFKTTTVSGQTVHYLAVPVVSPSWTIKNGNLYVALYPQNLSAALDQVGVTPSILKNPEWAALRQRLGGGQAGAIGFSDIKQSAGESYPTIQLMAQFLVGAGEMNGIDLPPMILPPLNKILPHLAPSASVFIADEKGLHFRSIEAFPGSTFLGVQGNMGGTQMMLPMVGVMLIFRNAMQERMVPQPMPMPANPPPPPF